MGWRYSWREVKVVGSWGSSGEESQRVAWEEESRLGEEGVRAMDS
jgi:hypothetical protein